MIQKLCRDIVSISLILVSTIFSGLAYSMEFKSITLPFKSRSYSKVSMSFAENSSSVFEYIHFRVENMLRLKNPSAVLVDSILDEDGNSCEVLSVSDSRELGEESISKYTDVFIKINYKPLSIIENRHYCIIHINGTHAVKMVK